FGVIGFKDELPPAVEQLEGIGRKGALYDGAEKVVHPIAVRAEGVGDGQAWLAPAHGDGVFQHTLLYYGLYQVAAGLDYFVERLFGSGLPEVERRISHGGVQ